MAEKKTGRDKRSLKNRGMEMGMKVVSRMLEDPDRAKKVIGVVTKVQRGKERLDDTTHRALNAGHLPSSEDMARIARHVGALRREVRRLKTRLESIRRKAETT
jgi:hypothetical protein